MENIAITDRETPFLFPLDMRDWVPKDHQVHFIIDAVEMISPKVGYHINTRGTGSRQLDPKMMMSLLICSYANKRFSSYAIEKATYTDVPTIYITAMTHPDHNTINNFRKNNKEAFKQVFVQVLLLAQTTGIMKKIGSINVDGTKMKANASKHKAVSYKYAKEQIAKYEKEVDKLNELAEKAEKNVEKLDLPKEIEIREKRISVLKEAVEQMEAAQKEIYEHEKAEYDRKMKEREEKERSTGKKTGGKPPKAPEEAVPDKTQVNFTDGDSRIMKEGNSKAFVQGYNMQAAVETESMLVVGTYATQNCNDSRELKKCVESVPGELEREDTVYATSDTGYFSGRVITETEKEHPEVKVICATERVPHGKTVEQLIEELPEKLPAEETADGEIPPMTTDRMRARLRTKEGQEIYAKRKETVEPVFGIIKQAMGFRQFLMRGLENISIEWDLVTIAYNLRRMFSLSQAAKSPKKSSKASRARKSSGTAMPGKAA